MLQLMEFSHFLLTRFTKIDSINKRLPHVKNSATASCTCSRCFYVNAVAHNFCTNCGYPLHDGETQLLFQFRTKQRKETLKKNQLYIQVSRTLLYALSALFVASSIGILFSRLYERFWVSLIAMGSAFLYFLLARWSINKPFTSFLTAFVIVLTFSTIAIFGEITQIFNTVQGIYTILVSIIISWILFKGIQSAYKTDLINEEMQIS